MFQALQEAALAIDDGHHHGLKEDQRDLERPVLEEAACPLPPVVDEYMYEKIPQTTNGMLAIMSLSRGRRTCTSRKR